ncbi:hypothetical protein B0J13DRAFT_459917, partial [Dactylonectria estremocensis]
FFLSRSISLACVCLFVLVKFNHSWSREIWLICLMGGWILLELTALILFSIEYGRYSKLPQALARSIHIILATMSLWGVAIIQITAIIYSFAVLKWIAILELVKVILIVIFAMVPEIPTPLELAYIAPVTSQAAAVGVIPFTARFRLGESRLLLGDGTLSRRSALY